MRDFSTFPEGLRESSEKSESPQKRRWRKTWARRIRPRFNRAWSGEGVNDRTDALIPPLLRPEGSSTTGLMLNRGGSLKNEKLNPGTQSSTWGVVGGTLSPPL